MSKVNRVYCQSDRLNQSVQDLEDPDPFPPTSLLQTTIKAKKNNWNSRSTFHTKQPNLYLSCPYLW
jgi:hypothetical protein